jgi:hypothetical protein
MELLPWDVSYGCCSIRLVSMFNKELDTHIASNKDRLPYSSDLSLGLEEGKCKLIARQNLII